MKTDVCEKPPHEAFNTDESIPILVTAHTLQLLPPHPPAEILPRAPVMSSTQTTALSRLVPSLVRCFRDDWG